MDATNTVTPRPHLLIRYSHTLRRRSLDRFLFFIFSSSFSLCSWAAASARSLVLRSCLAACAMVPLLLLVSQLLQSFCRSFYRQSRPRFCFSLCPPGAPSLTASSPVATTTCVCTGQAADICVDDATSSHKAASSSHTKKDATSGADAARLCRDCYSSTQLALR